MDDKNKEYNENSDPKDYLNKEKDFRFMFFGHWSNKKMSSKAKKVIKNTFLCSLPVMALLLGAVIGLSVNDNNETLIKNEVVINDNISKRRVYLLTDDNLTVPLTVSIDKKINIHEEMLDVINLLKVSSVATDEHLRGFLPDSTKVNSFQVDELNNLTVEFSSDLLQINNVPKNKVIDALYSSLMQFDDYNSVSIKVEDNFYCKNVTQCFHNISYTSLNFMKDKELVTLFYNRKFDDKTNYIIPVSVYAEKGDSYNMTFVNALDIDLPSSMNLNENEIYSQLSNNQKYSNEFSLTVNNTALLDEVTVNKELYEMVLLSLDIMSKDKEVSFNIEGEDLKVDGIIEDEEIDVSEIIYNEYEI